MKHEYPNGYPDVKEIERALSFLGWTYEGGHETAEELYEETFGDQQCFVRSPDGGLMAAVHFLYEAVGRLEDLEK